MKKACFVVVFVCLALLSRAQLNNQKFDDFFVQDSLEDGSRRLSFGVYNLNFLRNNEYFNKHVDGYTLFGAQLLSSLIFQVNPNLKVEAGVFLNKDFGENQFNQIQPMYRLHYSQKKFHFIFGNLKGHLFHNLPEPVFNFERVIQQRQEHGLQFLYTGDKFKLDAWIDWQRATYMQTSQKERIWAGGRLNWKLAGKGRFAMFGEGFLTVLHEGGQIDTSLVGAYSIFNGGAGLSMVYQVSETSAIRRLKLEAWGMQSVNPDREISGFVYTLGYGIYPNFTVGLKWFDVMASWWRGDSFVSQIGGPLYQSFSSNVNNPGRTEQQRNLLIIRFLKDFELAPGTSLTFRVEPVFDLNRNGKMEFSHGIYTNFKFLIPLKKWHEG